MAQAKRSQYAHFIDINKGVGTADYVREGIGVEALSITFNAQVDTYKTILSDTADSVFKNYDMQSSISGKRIFGDDEIYTMLDDARRKAIQIETTLIEVDMANTVNDDYVSVKYDILIVINEFLGEDATISYTIYYKNPVQGTATITNGTPTFTPSTDVNL